MSGPDYTGRFNDQGFRTGKGVQKFSESEACESYFVKGTPNGKTKYKWPDGETYQGRLCVGQKEGYATQKYPDGQIFHGLFRRNRRFGPGILTYPSGQQDVGLWENNTLLRCCTTQSFLPPLPPIGPIQHRLRTLINEEPPNVAAEKLRKAGGEGCEEYAHLLYCPYVRQPDSLSLDNKTLRTAYRDGMPWGERHRIAAWNNMDHYCKMQMHAFNNRRFQKEIPHMISRVMKNERTMFNERGVVEENTLEFLWAATQGDYRNVKEFLLKNRIDPDVADGGGNTPIILASAYWHPEVVTLLLDWAADINGVNDDGLSPLIVAMLRYYTKYKTVAAIDDLYFKPIELNPGQDQAKEEQPLVWTGEIDMSLCRTLDSPPVTLSSIAAPPLARPAKKQRHKIQKSVSSRADLLMKRSITPSVTPKASSVHSDNSSSTVKKESVREAWVEEPRLPRPFALLSRLPVNWFRGQPRYRQINKEEELPLPSAARSKDSMIVLEDFDSGNRPLSRAASRRAKKEEDDQYQEKLKQMRYLSEKKAKPLMYATIEVLLRRGANIIINQVTGDVTPLTLAVRAGDLTMVKYLLNKGADPNMPLPDVYGGVAPLHIAAHVSHYPDIGKIIKTLLDAGADPTQRALPDMSFALERPERKDLVMEWINSEGYQLQGMQPLHVACSRERENLEDKIIKVSEVELSPIKSAAEERKAIKYLFKKERLEKGKSEQSSFSKMKHVVLKLQSKRKKIAEESKIIYHPDKRGSNVIKGSSIQKVGTQSEMNICARNIAIPAKKLEISDQGGSGEQGPQLFQKRGRPTGSDSQNLIMVKEFSSEAISVGIMMTTDSYEKIEDVEKSGRQKKLPAGDSKGKAGARKQYTNDETLGTGDKKSSDPRKIRDGRKTEPTRNRDKVEKYLEGKEVKFKDSDVEENDQWRHTTRQRLLTTTVKSLIKGGADVNEEVYGQNPLSLAIKHGNEFLLNALLDAGADPNKDLSMGTGSALVAAVSIDNELGRNLKEQKEILRTLLKKGGDITKKLKIKPDDKEGVPIAEFYHQQVDATRKEGYEKSTGFNDRERGTHRKQMREHLGRLRRKDMCSRLGDVHKRVDNPNLTEEERQKLVVDLREVLMKTIGSMNLAVPQSIATTIFDLPGSDGAPVGLIISIKICIECGRKLPKKKSVQCKNCKIKYCSELCMKNAILRNHHDNECVKIRDCLAMLEPPKVKEHKYFYKKPILRKAVGYILTESKKKNVLLTATEIQLHGTDLEENYSFD